MRLSIEAANALRSGLIDIAFDGARLRFVQAEARGWLAGTPAPVFRANAPPGLGRVSLSFSATSPVAANGDMARLVFQALDTASGSPYVRLEALSMIDAAGRVVSAQLPATFSLTLGQAK